MPKNFEILIYIHVEISKNFISNRDSYYAFIKPVQNVESLLM